MDLLLILTYTAIAYAAFKIFKIPVNRQRRSAASSSFPASCF
jgi:hypothetical protein